MGGYRPDPAPPRFASVPVTPPCDGRRFIFPFLRQAAKAPGRTLQPNASAAGAESVSRCSLHSTS